MSPDRVKALLDNVADACIRVGKKREDVKIVAATKCVNIDVINELPQYGILSVGENRVQEFLTKYNPSSPLEWHIIGALQTNKVKQVVGKVSLIQSVDRASLAAEIQKQSARSGVVTNVLIEVNAAGEPNKSGVSSDNIEELADVIASCPNIKLAGLMSVPPRQAPIAVYDKIKSLYDRLAREYPSCNTLSVGMSEDYQTAILCGANMIRPGRALFGERKITTKENGNEI